MQTARGIKEGTTLYLTELSNGLICTLSIRDIGKGEHEKHVWMTSYPMLEHLYPHWVPKQPVNSQVNFLDQALKQAENAFGWKFVAGKGSFISPEVRFGEGVSKVVAFQEHGIEGMLTPTLGDDAVVVYKKNSISVGEKMLSQLEDFTKPVLLVIVNFLSIEIIECFPKSIGNYKRWEYKSSKVVFDTQQEFVDHIVTRRFMPYVGEHVPENHLFNTILNYVYWSPIHTSSKVVKDLWRAITTSLINEVSLHTSIQKYKEGHIIVTGEVPVFINDSARMQLAVMDGLGLSGLWTISVDEYFQILPHLADNTKNSLINEVSNEKTSLWIIPQLQKQGSVVTLSQKDKVVRGVYGTVYTYRMHGKLHDVVYSVGNTKKDILGFENMRVGKVTMDLRPWPVIYGPNTLANSEKVPMWVDRITNCIKET